MKRLLNDSRLLLGILVLAGLFVLGVVFALVMPWLFTGRFAWNVHDYFNPDGLRDDRFEVVLAQLQASTMLVQLLGGLLFFAVLLTTLYQTVQANKRAEDQISVSQQALSDNATHHQDQMRLSREQLAETQQNNDEQLAIAAERAITERFTRAIEQLGGEHIEIRLGGIYALEKIAQDSIERYHWTVMEILTAYVRQNAPALTGEAASSLPDPDYRTPIDIQAILTVIGRRTTVQRAAEREALDLSGTSLRKADLAEGNWQKAHFSRAQLQSANFGKAQLQGAELVEAQLQNANFIGAKVRGGLLSMSNLQQAVLYSADLKEARLIEAQMQRASLIGAKMQGAVLTDANLQETVLYQANLENAEGLTQAQIDETCMSDFTILDSHFVKSRRDCTENSS